MKRDPSIHITQSAFINLCNSLKIELDQTKVNKLFRSARAMAVNHRSIITTTKKVATKAQRGIGTNIGDTQLLADIIYSTRISLKHVGVTKIKQSDPQWASLKELVPVVNDFCEASELPKRKGYIEFVKIGIDLATKTKRSNMNYFASWAIKKAGWIIDTWNAAKEVMSDKYPSNTRELVDLYISAVASITGIAPIIKLDDYTSYINFIKAREQADQMGLDYESYIEAQFEALEFCNGIPQVADLGNQKAYERVIRYLGKHKITVVQEEQQEQQTDLWQSFKK